MTAQIYRFPKHKLARCEEGCAGCFICDGGLSLCLICGGAEASLTTHCPGVMLQDEIDRAVALGQIDFFNGEWIHHQHQERRK